MLTLVQHFKDNTGLQYVVIFEILNQSMLLTGPLPRSDAPGIAICHGHGPCFVRLATDGTGSLQGEVDVTNSWEESLFRNVGVGKPLLYNI